MIAIPDDDEKPSPTAEQEKNGVEPMETDKPSNGEAEGVKEREGEKEGGGEKKNPDEGEEAKSSSEAKTEGSEAKPVDSEVKGMKLVNFPLKTL